MRQFSFFPVFLWRLCKNSTRSTIWFACLGFQAMSGSQITSAAMGTYDRDISKRMHCEHGVDDTGHVQIQVSAVKHKPKKTKTRIILIKNVIFNKRELS